MEITTEELSRLSKLFSLELEYLQFLADETDTLDDLKTVLKELGYG